MRSTIRPNDTGILLVFLGVATAAIAGLQRSGTGEQPRRSAAGALVHTASPSDAGRGRDAETPSDIPAAGWKDIVWRTYEQVQSDRVLAVGAGVTFYALLAIFPFITAFVSLYGLIADPVSVQSHLQSLGGVVPAEALTLLGDQMRRLTEKSGDALGFGFFFGLAFALWSANAGMKAIFDALNVACGETEKRGFFALNAITLLFTLGAIVFLILAAATVVVVPAVLSFVGLGPVGDMLLRFSRWPLLLAGIAFAITVLYRYGPSRTTAKWRWVTWGSALASLLFLVLSLLFSWYAANFGSYDKTYGSLGTVIAFMTWIWISSVIVLIGAEFNAEIEHQTERDSTVGSVKPMGRRGARMADTVGKESV